MHSDHHLSVGTALGGRWPAISTTSDMTLGSWVTLSTSGKVTLSFFMMDCFSSAFPSCWSAKNNNNNNNNNNNGIETCNSRFFTISSLSRELSLTHSGGQGAIVCKSSAAHQALNTCNLSCATWYEGTAELLSLADSKSHLFQLHFSG